MEAKIYLFFLPIFLCWTIGYHLKCSGLKRQVQLGQEKVKIYPTIKNSILLCLSLWGIFIACVFLTSVFRVIISTQNNIAISSEETNIFFGVVLALAVIISWGIVLAFGFIKTERKFNDVFKFNKVSLFLWIAIIIFMAGFYILISELSIFLKYIMPMLDMPYQRSEPYFVKENPVFRISVGIVSCFALEMFFRGLILDGLKNNYSKKKAIIISALLSAIFYFNYASSEMNVLAVFVAFFIFGLFAAWICINTNSILLCIYMQFFYSLLTSNEIRSLIPITGFSSIDVTSAECRPLWYYLIGLAFFILGIILLKKGFEKSKTITKNLMRNSDSMTVQFPINAKLIFIIISTMTVTLYLVVCIFDATFRTKMSDDLSIKENNQKHLNTIITTAVYNHLYNIIRPVLLNGDNLLNADTTEETKERFFMENKRIVCFFTSIPDSRLQVDQILVNEEFFKSKGIELDLVNSYIENQKNANERDLRGEVVLLNAAPHFGIPVLAYFFNEPDGVFEGILLSSGGILEEMGISEKNGRSYTNILINKDGDILLHDDFSFVESGVNLSNNDKIRSAIENRTDFDSYKDKYDFRLLQPSDNQYFVTCHSFGTLGVMFTSFDYEISTNKIINDARNGFIIVFVIFIIIFIITIRYAISFSRNITNPLKMLAVAAHNIGEGIFDFPFKAEKRNDEIGVLMENFKKMCGALNVFGKFTNKEIAIKAMRGEIKPGGLNKYAAILFCDIRDFTEKSERFTKLFGDDASDHIVRWLNQYFAQMIDCIEKTNGVVDKFIGDAIMAHWGTVYSAGSRELDAFNSVKAALMMREALLLMNMERQQGDPANPPIKMGCGINSGIVTAGQIGSDMRMEYTIIGDPVNLTSRIEGLTKTHSTDILISEDIWLLTRDKFITEEMPSTMVKGKEKPVRIFAVIDFADKADGLEILADVREHLGIMEKL